MPSIRVLKTFLSVARHGSFSAASAEIGLTAAAVGLQMRALEEHVGQTLFDRGSRAIVLNTAGRQMIAPAQALVRDYEALVASDREDLAGTVVMGALVSALMGAFASALWRLKRDHPALEVKLFAGLSADFAHRVDNGELDAAVTTQPPRMLPSTLVWTPLYRESMVLIVPKRPHFELKADALEILRTAPFLRFDRSTWTGNLVAEVLAKCRVVVNEALEVNSVETIVALVRQGYGVSIVPKLDNVKWSRDTELRVMEIPGNRIERSVGLLERSHHSRTQFTAAIKQHFRART